MEGGKQKLWFTKMGNLNVTSWIERICAVIAFGIKLKHKLQWGQQITTEEAVSMKIYTSGIGEKKNIIFVCRKFYQACLTFDTVRKAYSIWFMCSGTLKKKEEKKKILY